MGLPSKYSQEIIDASIDYMETHETFGDLVPSIVGLSNALGVSRSTLYLWADEYKEFSDILEGVNAQQERKLLSGGLGGDYNSAIVKLMLGKHGYTDRQQTEVSGVVNISVTPDGYGKL